MYIHLHLCTPLSRTVPRTVFLFFPLPFLLGRFIGDCIHQETPPPPSLFLCPPLLLRSSQAFFMMVAALVLLSLLKLVFKDSIPRAKKITKTAKQVATSMEQSTRLVKEEAAIAYSQLSAAKYLMGAPSDVSLARRVLIRYYIKTNELWVWAS